MRPIFKGAALIVNATLFSAVLVSGLHALEQVECEYEANSEWPWVAGRVCQADTPQTAPLISDDDSTVWSWPICVSNVDPDGDGWGWENFRSCRMSDKPETTETTDAFDAYPACVDVNSDPDGDTWGWENFRSCRVRKDTAPVADTAADSGNGGTGSEAGASGTDNSTPETGTSAPVSTNQIETPKEVTPDIGRTSGAVIYEQGFEDASAGGYSAEQLNADWDSPLWHLGVNNGRANIVWDSQKGNALQVRLPAFQYGASGATAFLNDLAFGVGFDGHYEELYVSYDVKFAEGFDFVRGGKLPGLCGYNTTQSPGQGCNTGGGYPDGYDGWSARGMWREDGILENYVYHSAQENYYGDDEYWDVKAVPGQWHRVQHRVVLNNVGKADGILEAWFDGRKVLTKSNYVYRKTADIKANLFYFTTFYGGNDASWAPSSDQYIYFDNFRIATEPLEGTQASNQGGNESIVLQDDDAASMQKVSSGGGGATGSSLLLLMLLCCYRRAQRRI